jgi:hypothetical protein
MMEVNWGEPEAHQMEAEAVMRLRTKFKMAKEYLETLKELDDGSDAALHAQKLCRFTIRQLDTELALAIQEASERKARRGLSKDWRRK